MGDPVRSSTSFPAELTDRKQWLVWRFEDGEAGKKPRKMPYYANGRRRAGTQGDDGDRAALVTYAEAQSAVAAGRFSGLGFAFLPGDGLIGIDIDAAFGEEGERKDRAEGIIKACGSYTEWSPSGTGVHIIVEGETKTFKDNGVGVEVFCGRQFFTMTGNSYHPDPLPVMPIRAEVLQRLYDVVKGKVNPPSNLPKVQPVAVAHGGVQAVNDELDPQRLEGALSHVDCEDYHLWVDVGMALKAGLGESGFALWDRWSAKSAKYGGSDSLYRKWQSFTNLSSIGVGKIYRAATDAGWRPARREPGYQKSISTQHWACAEPVQEPLPAQAEGRVEEGMPVEQDDWLDELVVNPKTGTYKAVLYNVHLILMHDLAWRGVIAYNRFAKRIEKLKSPPYFGGEVGAWSDVDTTKTLMWLQKRYDLDLKDSSVVDRAVLAVGQDCSFHPVREYLDSLRWDGVSRLAHIFNDVFGSLESYAGEAGQNFMVAAVARIYQPGCKVDEMIVLEGPQGAQKSTAIRGLFSPRFYLEQSEDPSGKDFYLCLQGKWGIEIGEMNSFRRAQDWTAVKLAISRRTDKFRAPYDRHPMEQDRECVFLGTTNDDEWLNDPTGGRRFIPIKAMQIGDLPLIEANRDQYWAEAVALYRAKHKWWVYSEGVMEELEFERDARQLSDSWIEPITRWLDGRGKSNDYEGMTGPINKATTNQILIGAIGFSQDKIMERHEQRVGKIMKRLKWHKRRGSAVAGSNYRPWVFIRPESDCV
ncbi:VapE domain-containing protein [Chitinibacter sp. GC72]|uniref:VapE domain-containing protein n=1 Tax=Chitinibacter sp. GC72 TaxID=1526917 RepID=UPI0012FB0F5C|nr:VapE domain-containing protein [Chitinibacter sp. GC72]